MMAVIPTHRCSCGQLIGGEGPNKLGFIRWKCYNCNSVTTRHKTQHRDL